MVPTDGLKTKSIDLNGLYDSIKHDLNHSFTDEQYLNKFDLVTDFGSCEHVFNIAEAYKTMHKLTIIRIHQIQIMEYHHQQMKVKV